VPLAKPQTIELRFPSLGVVRRTVQERVASAVSYPAVWASNVRLDDPLDRRLRGGSRPGLTKFVADDMGTTIADIAHISVSSAAGGASDILVVLVNSTIKTVENGTTTTYGSAPASGLFVTGQQHAFVITTSAIVKVNPKTGSISNLSASAGTIPTNCTFGAIYRDRMCLSGKDNAIYMSRQGDYTNWSFGVDVSRAGRAIPFQLSLGADVGPLPTALIAHKDSYLLAASARTLWVVRGDPGGAGQLVRVSENVGIVSSRAWCTIEDQVCFLAEDGLYRISADGSDLKALSENIPAELRDVDTSTVTVRMGYEHDRKTVHVFLRTASGSDTHWVYELIGEAWWPVRIQDDHSPVAVAQHKGELLLAGGDGYIRQVGGDDDDGTAIDSHVVLGPIRLANSGFHGIARSLHTIMAQGSGTVTWRFVTGDTADEASDNAKLAIEAFQAGSDYSNYVKASGAISAGRSPWAYPRVRSPWLCLWYQSSSKWAFESTILERAEAGRWRGF